MSIPIIYIHGFIGHLRFPELTTGLDPETVWAPDLLGYGAHEDAPLSDLSIKRQSEHLAQWIDQHVGPSPAIMVGHSAGVAIVVRYAKAFPSRVAAIVSAEGNLAPSDAFLSSRLAPMSASKVAHWLEETRRNPGSLLTSDGHHLKGLALERLSEWLNHQPAEVLHAAARAVLLETLTLGYAGDVMGIMATIPTFLICGERTPMGLGVSPRLRDLAQASFIIPGTGHAMVLENPVGVALAIGKILMWVQRHSVRG